MEIEAFALELFRIGGVKFGEFTLKSGQKSPVYVDLRGLVSHPAALRAAGEALAARARTVECDCLAGLPYAGLPLAVSASLASGIPAIYPRKEAKAYGTGQRVEGEIRPGQVAVVIDDVITTGGAKLELIEPLTAAGLVVRDVVVLIDRQQGGAEALREHGLTLHSVFTLPELLTALRKHDAISPEQFEEVRAYLERSGTAR
ncbi:MAG: orotate phosphoribosyltransferase [Armatimonadota bacterium]